MQLISKYMYLPFRGREGGGRGNLNSIETDDNQAVMMNVVAPPISKTGTNINRMHLQNVNCDLYSFARLLQV